MKNKRYILILLLSVFSLQSCAAVGGIFKAGAATGVIIVVLVISLIVFLISRSSKK